MDKPVIKKFAIWARNKLIVDTKYRAGLIGVTETAIAEPLPQSTEAVQFFDVGLPQPYRIEGDAVTQRQRFVAELNKETAKQGSYTAAYQTVVDKVAYTWFNRLIAVRYMEVNDLLPSRTRVLSSADGRAEPQIVTSPFDAVLDYTPAEQQQIVSLKNDNRLDEVFRLLFLKQCAALGDCLPRLFEQVDDYMPLLLAISFTDKDGVVCHLVNDIPESDWQDAVQIVGWLYQYYNTEPKAKVFADLNEHHIKISAANIPAATQLFTPDWIVRYMVENSLGRLWSEGHPDFDKSEWKYYLDEAPQEPQVAQQLAELRKGYAALTPEDIKCIDPCMGSGHILAYLFDVLMQIYRSAGYTDRDAAASIVEHNLYGLDIDDRAAQMAYFVVMMKGCPYDSRFLRRHLNPHVYAVDEDSKGISTAPLHDMGLDLCSEEYSKAVEQTMQLIDIYKDAKEYGSLLNVPQLDWDLLRRFAVPRCVSEGTMGIDIHGEVEASARLQKIINVAEILSAHYDVVVTNPPYMGGSGMNARLSEYVKKYYPDSKSDLFAVFIERCAQMDKRGGYQAMITQHAWMFLSSFEKLRAKLQMIDTVNMAHLGARGFDEIGGEVVQTTSFVMRSSHTKGYKGTYCRLIDGDSEKVKADMFVSGENRYVAEQDNFSKIPGSPVAYWASNLTYDAFCGDSIGNHFLVKAGMCTGDNNKFIVLWPEVDFTKSSIATNHYLYTPHNKGGDFRKWYGNRNYFLKYSKESLTAMEKNAGFRHDGKEYYFQPHIGWSKITSAKSSFRYYECGFTFDSAGLGLFAKGSALYPTLAFLNSKVSESMISILNPTLNVTPLIVKELPYNEADVSDLVERCISLSKSDWDSFETSWDFKTHPLVELRLSGAYAWGDNPPTMHIESAYKAWRLLCEGRFQKLKEDEEELNRIFIDIYGLQNELTPEVEDKDITVRRADLGRDIRSLISYAVGCIFGRYSLDQPGLAYAGGDWNPDQYHTFLPDADNVIPITDEEYFTDDLTGLFVAWVKKVFGADSLEDNLAFIAKALGTKGTSPRAVIRNYFLNGFYADHVKIYQKRPIYWLYDSGKQNGFKALIYMHRYNADTSGTVRAEYLYKMEQVYESEIARMDDAIAHGASREVAQATKRKEKLVKQLKECKDYDDRLGHIALARIPIDLDDGVKLNYEKVQTGADGKKQAILAKI